MRGEGGEVGALELWKEMEGGEIGRRKDLNTFGLKQRENRGRR